MNVHHLELFYYVALHGGISEAVRHIPYGIQQPAVSNQIIQLEEYLGVTLFQRRPFMLTASGQELFAFIQPFFGRLESITTKLQGGVAHHIRIGASEVVLREHMPAILQMVRQKIPRLNFALREGYQPQVEIWLERQEIDLALTLLSDKQPPFINAQALLKLPLMLLLPLQHPIQSAEELWKMDKINEPLITLPAYESMCRNFQEGLTAKGLDWFPSIEVSSLNLIETYVANGYGIGLFLDIPKIKLMPAVRALRLTDFEPVNFGAMWRGKVTPVLKVLLEVFQMHVQALKRND